MLSVRLLGAPLHPHTLRGPARALSGTRTLTLLLSLSLNAPPSWTLLVRSDGAAEALGLGRVRVHFSRAHRRCGDKGRRVPHELVLEVRARVAAL